MSVHFWTNLIESISNLDSESCLSLLNSSLEELEMQERILSDKERFFSEQIDLRRHRISSMERDIATERSLMTAEEIGHELARNELYVIRRDLMVIRQLISREKTS